MALRLRSHSAERDDRFRRGRPLAVAAVAILAVAVRLPALMSTRWLGYDDGVYGASVMALRAGGLPFRDVFSSQGPLFLPLLWIADLAGLRTMWAPRLTMVAAAALVTVATYLVACRVAPTRAALGAAFLVATSGSVLLAAGPIEADGVALALGTLAIALAATPLRPGRGRAITIGLVLGAAMAAKSLYAVPAVIVVAWILLQRDRRDRIVPAATSAAALGLGLSLPWGLGHVWDQYVAFHLAVPTDREPIANLREVVTTLARLDRLTLGAVAVAVVTAAVRWVRNDGAGPRRTATTGPERALALVPFVWLGASAFVVVVLSQVDGGFLRYIAYLVPPLAVLAAGYQPSLLAVAAVATVLVPGHLGALSHHFELRRPDPVEAAAMADLHELAGGHLVVTDEPGLAWAAGLTTPPNLVDLSFNRIAAGYLSVDEMRAELARPDVCGLLAWNGRLHALDPMLTADLHLVRSYGDGRALYATPGCDSTT